MKKSTTGSQCKPTRNKHRMVQSFSVHFEHEIIPYCVLRMRPTLHPRTTRPTACMLSAIGSQVFV